jgi:hypothetical protein
MGLDNIQLPAIVLHHLFKDSLVDLNTYKIDNENIAAGNLSYLGNNQKKVAIIVADEQAIYLPDEDLNFLMGVLAACKLTMADVALINIKKNDIFTYVELEQQLKAEKLLLLGVTPPQLELPLQFPNYQIQKFNSQIYLAAPALHLLAIDKTEKTKLWNCLKQVFSIT